MLKKLKDTLAQLQTRREEIKAKMDAGEEIPQEEQDEYLANVEKSKDVLARIRALEAADESAADIDDYVANHGTEAPAHTVVVKGPAAEQERYPLGRYLQDIVVQARTGNALPRVANYQKKVPPNYLLDLPLVKKC